MVSDFLHPLQWKMSFYISLALTCPLSDQGDIVLMSQFISLQDSIAVVFLTLHFQSE